VFYILRHLRVGARITVARREGSTAVFDLTGTQQVRRGTFPTRAVYDDVDHPARRLITSGGSFDHTAPSYRDDIVVRRPAYHPRRHLSAQYRPRGWAVGRWGSS